MAYRLNKKGKAVVIAILFALAYVFAGLLIDSFLQEQEQLKVKSEQLREQINNMKHKDRVTLCGVARSFLAFVVVYNLLFCFLLLITRNYLFVTCW